MKEHVVSVRLDEEEYKFMQRWAQNSGMKVSDILRQMIRNSRNSKPGGININPGSLTIGATQPNGAIWMVTNTGGGYGS